MSGALAAAVAGIRRRLGGTRGGLLLAALALGVALLEPKLSWPKAEHDLLIVLDVTQSMEVADVQRDGQPVTRLAAAKAALDQSLRRLPCGSRVGWGLFTEYRSFLLMQPVEVCENQRELLSMLHRIDGRMAWTGNSEVAKGVFSGLKIAKALPDKPALVFVTDGQEAPPVNPKYRPNEDGAAGAAPGLIVGVGGLLPVPIPKLDLEGRAYGFWEAGEVLQVDPRSLGRGGSVANEQMSDEGESTAAPMVGATPGSEHLSSLREPYLQVLATELQLDYLRLGAHDDLYAALTQARMARPVEARRDVRWVFGMAALVAVLVPYLRRR